MKHTDISPLGAAALAGTTFPIDREMTAELWALPKPYSNSLDAVSDRDFYLGIFWQIVSIFDDAYEPYL